MKHQFTVIALALSAVALFLPTRSQTFTHVSIDGKALRMLIAGSGTSTVVFENGLGPPLEMWGKVQPRVSRFARTVTYDRAGVGFSETGPSPRDGRRIASELRDALRAADVPPPYVLVGASLGGLYVRVFAGMYPEDVSGIVLVDPTHDLETPDRPVYPELDVAQATLVQARTSLIPPRIPLVLIDAVSPDDVPFASGALRAVRAKNRSEIDAESRAYRDWLDTIPGARLIVTHDSGHNVPIEQPDLVIETIRQVVAEAANRRR